MVEEDMASPVHQQDMASMHCRENMVTLDYGEDAISQVYQEVSFLDSVAALDEGVVLVEIPTQEVV
jgi:hypothetical protein